MTVCEPMIEVNNCDVCGLSHVVVVGVCCVIVILLMLFRLVVFVDVVFSVGVWCVLCL